MDRLARRIRSMKSLGLGSMRYAGKLAGASVTITVDCGSEDNFIAESVLKSLGLAGVVLEEPIDVEVASGNLLRGSHATHKLQHTTGGRKEHVSLIIADIQGLDVILGIPWLEQHNPRVDWRTRQLSLTIGGEDVELKPA